MLFRTLGSAMLVLAVCTLGLQAQAQKDGKKDVKVEGKEVVGKIKSVNVEKSDFTLTLGDGKDRTFHVTKDTEFVGPRGGVSKDGLKDDRMVKGSEVAVKVAGDNKTAREVKLPIRKKAEKDKK
jgi:hypothetical protein